MAPPAYLFSLAENQICTYSKRMGSRRRGRCLSPPTLNVRSGRRRCGRSHQEAGWRPGIREITLEAQRKSRDGGRTVGGLHAIASKERSIGKADSRWGPPTSRPLYRPAWEVSWAAASGRTYPLIGTAGLSPANRHPPQRPGLIGCRLSGRYIISNGRSRARVMASESIPRRPALVVL